MSQIKRGGGAGIARAPPLAAHIPQGLGGDATAARTANDDDLELELEQSPPSVAVGTSRGAEPLAGAGRSLPRMPPALYDGTISRLSRPPHAGPPGRPPLTSISSPAAAAAVAAAALPPRPFVLPGTPPPITPNDSTNVAGGKGASNIDEGDQPPSSSGDPQSVMPNSERLAAKQALRFCAVCESRATFDFTLRRFVCDEVPEHNVCHLRVT